jgi:Uncharacterized protein conserved in bacteria
MTDNKWFSNCYRRNLVDMHIDDWNSEFLSKFSPDEYLDNLRRAHIQAPMIYLQSHAGLCYYPTKVGHMHASLIGREDIVRRLVELCRADGMSVVGYYSLIFNTREEDIHPEWRIVTDENGTSARQRGGRYGLCCPNNPEYRKFISEQIHEIAEYFTLDGMFYDMTFWPGICRCEHCMKLYKMSGLDAVPATDWASSDWMKLIDIRVKSMGEFAKFVTRETRRIMPGVSVEHNYACAVAADSIDNGTSELINEQCDYTGGDLYGDLYNHSFTAKYYYGVTKNAPFEYMTCRCDRSLGAHTVTKSEESLATEVMLTAAHHGASFIIDAIDPVGTLDSRVYDRIGKVFDRQLPYEKYFSGRLLRDVGVYYSSTGRYNSRGLGYTSKTCSVGAVKALIEYNIPVGVIANSGTGDISDCKAVVAPAIAGISDDNRADLVRYVENGGILYISGAEDMKLLELLFDARFDGYTEETAVYLAPTEIGQKFFGEFNSDYPLPSDLSLPKLTLSGCQTLATMKLPYTKANERRFASIHSNPPGISTDIPALVTKQVGNGRVIWSAAPIENDGRLSHKRLFVSLLRGFMGEQTLTSDAPRQVELVTFIRENDILVSAVDLLCTDELLAVREFEIRVATGVKPAQVLKLGGKSGTDTSLCFNYTNGITCFKNSGLIMFDMYRIILS